jgi:hypothetical protein
VSKRSASTSKEVAVHQIICGMLMTSLLLMLPAISGLEEFYVRLTTHRLEDDSVHCIALSAFQFNVF